MLDLWHLANGPWTAARMVAMRFQNSELVDETRLLEYAQRFDSPRLLSAANVWLEFAGSEQDGVKEL